MAHVFISHATVDLPFVEAFVDTLLLDCGLDRGDIFVSSIPGMDIPAGSDLMAEVRKEVSAATLVFAIITPIYSTRPVCVAELGAAWGVAGKLIPLLAPGVRRGDLDGVLPSLKTTHLDEEATLDAVQDAIEQATGARPHKAATWTRAKQKWLGIAGDLAAQLEVPETFTAEEREALVKTNADLSDALNDAEAESSVLREQIEALKAAKDVDEVKAILMPTDQIERFEHLRGAARDAMSRVPWAVDYALWVEEAGGQWRWPNKLDDPGFHDRMDEAVEQGMLTDGGEGELELNRGLRVVRLAADAVRAVIEDLLRFDYDGDFLDWFEEEFGGEPDLSARAVWDMVFP